MKSKRNWVVMTLIFCGILSTYGQSTKYFVGLKSGFAIPNLTNGATSTPLSEGYTSRLGYYGGIVTELRTRGRFGLRAEINYSSQGGKRNGSQALAVPAELQQLWQMLSSFSIPHDDYMYANIKSEAFLNYIEVPVMAKYSFNLGSRLNFYLQAGPYLGVLLNAKNVTTGSSSIYADKAGTIPVDAILQQAEMPPLGEQSFDHTESITSDIKRINVGGQGALGFGLIMDSGRFFIEGGGNYGFIPVQKDNVNGTNNTGAGTITVGYLHQL